MRTAFIKELTQVAREDDRICLLMAEVGFSVVEGFEAEFPGRFYNTGIAEQDLVNIACGMALRGKKPVAYSMAPFLPSRAFEQIKINVCYQNLPVVLVGVGTGMSYSNMGATHHAPEDLAIMSSLPNMTVLCPCDPVETRHAVRKAFELNAPCYIAIGKTNDPTLHQGEIDFKIGKAIKMTEGSDVAILSTGGITQSALLARERLLQKGLSVKIFSMHTVKPLDGEAIAEAFRCGAVFTLEEHNAASGLGNAVAGFALEAGLTAKHFKRLSIPDCFTETVGGRDYQQRVYGIDGEGVYKTIAKTIGLE